MERSARLKTQGADVLPVVKALRTLLHRTGKDNLSTRSLNPYPINQVPAVKPIKGSRLNHLAATLQAPSANPWGQAAFSSVTQQNKLTLGPAASCSQTARCSRAWAEAPGGTTGNRRRAPVSDLQKRHFPMVPAKGEQHRRRLISLGQPRRAPASDCTQASGQRSKVGNSTTPRADEATEVTHPESHSQ